MQPADPGNVIVVAVRRDYFELCAQSFVAEILASPSSSSANEFSLRLSLRTGQGHEYVFQRGLGGMDLGISESQVGGGNMLIN